MNQMLHRLWVFLVCAFLTAPCFAVPNLEARIDRPLRYTPQGIDFVIENGSESFNRPLYGSGTAFRVDAGDKPEISMFLPGRGGNLRLGVRGSGGAKWLNDASHIVARYRPGGMFYEITDPIFGGGTIEAAILALPTSEGVIVRANLRGDDAPLELIWAFGGANGDRGSRDGDIGTERQPVTQFFQLRPEYCRDNAFTVSANVFTMRSKPATIVGLASSGALLGVGDANQWGSPQGLLDSVGNQGEPHVVVGHAPLKQGAPLFIGLQRAPQASDNAEELATYREVRSELDTATTQPTRATSSTQPTIAFNVGNLPAIFEDAEAHRKALAEKVVVDTPDAFINAAAAAICVAADGVWDEPTGTVQHGAVAWRSRLLGWRGPYANDALGWHDRARRHFNYWTGRQNTSEIPEKIPVGDANSTGNFSRNEPALHSNGDMSNSHYDMNMVAIDALFRHILWTGDMEYAKKVWPVIERHLAWEKRLFRRPFGPDSLPLYEGYANFWASDDVAYSGGGATQATAYNYFHNLMAAKIARAIGQDPKLYDQESELIGKAMRSQLWLSDRGWFADWKDYLGLQLVHPSAALWTLYHTVDSQVPTPAEAWQMTRFVDTQIAHIPLRGPGVPDGGYYTLPTTNWMPYTWSTNNVVMAEVAHTALAYWQAQRPDEAFKIYKGCLLDSMFMGLCPGNAGMATTFDVYRNESQRDFGDAAGMDSRALIEGLFGIHPDAVGGELFITPGFPSEWNRASIKHSDFTFAFERRGTTDTYRIEPRFSRAMSVRIQVPALRDDVESVTVNGRAADWRVLEDAVGTPRIEIKAPAGPRLEIVVAWQGKALQPVGAEAIIATGSGFRQKFADAKAIGVVDPQRVLAAQKIEPDGISGTVSGTPGHRTVFAKLQQGKMTWLLPNMLEVRAPFEVVQHDKGVRIRNNTGTNSMLSVRIAGRASAAPLAVAPTSDSADLELPENRLLPGANAVEVVNENGLKAEGQFTNWDSKAAANTKWEPIALESVFNDRVTQIFQQQYLSPRSPFCSLAIPLQGIGSWCRPTAQFNVNDSGLRRVAGENNGQIILPQGIPLRTPGPGDGKNIAFVSQWDNYPRSIDIPLSGNASHVYLLMAGSTNSMQSRFDNGEVVVTYADGSTQRLALENPTNWWPINEDYLIDDYAFNRPEPLPVRVDLQTGNVRTLEMSSFKGRMGRLTGGSATVLDLPLKLDKPLKSLKVRAIANEVVIGLMSVTLVRE